MRYAVLIWTFPLLRYTPQQMVLGFTISPQCSCQTETSYLNFSLWRALLKRDGLDHLFASVSNQFYMPIPDCATIELSPSAKRLHVETRLLDFPDDGLRIPFFRVLPPITLDSTAVGTTLSLPGPAGPGQTQWIVLEDEIQDVASFPDAYLAATIEDSVETPARDAMYLNQSIRKQVPGVIALQGANSSVRFTNVPFKGIMYRILV